MSHESAQVFKGMRRYRYYEPQHSLTDALRSPYIWWWRYLRMSKNYWWVCQRRGAVGDERLRSMYRDFGDVYGSSFQDWWLRRGVNLFMEQKALARVRALDANDLRLSREQEDHLLLELPVFMTEQTILKQVRELLRNHERRHVERRSSAKRALAKYVGLKQDVIEIARQVWQTSYEAQDPNIEYQMGKPQGNKSLYQIGKELRLVASCMPQTGDTIERTRKRVNGMKVAVTRMLRRADNLIANAETGVFPSVAAPREPIQIRQAQQVKLEESVKAGFWRPLFDDEETLESKLKTNHPSKTVELVEK
jgi:hypothetical protein